MGITSVPPSLPSQVPHPPAGHLMPTVEFPPQSLLPSQFDMSVNGLKPESELMEKISNATGSLPSWIRDPMYNHIIKKVNNFIFRSAPPGGPRPEDPSAWKFSAVGDMGNGTKAQADVAANLLKYKPEIVLTAGDNVYPDSQAQHWQQHFDPPELFGNILNSAPVLPSLGNHDIDPNPDEYFMRFPWLKGSRYYSADYKNIHVVALDTNDSLAPGSVQASWLEHDLATTRQPWKIIEFHHPMKSVISKYHYKNTSKLSEFLGPMLAKHGVDMVLVGHEHWYERSKPLNDAGTIQITDGGGGGALYPFPYPQQAWSATRDIDFGHVNFEVRGDKEIIGRYVKRDGSIGDTFVLNHPDEPASAAATPAPVAAPVAAPVH
ncbi:MAG: metallophosphoesterase [Thermoleophilia bacterium]|nr:metallophosphoesterase [Thermoleophilia bacterium]